MKRKNLLIIILCIFIAVAIYIVVDDDIKIKSSNFRNLVSKLENNDFESKNKMLEEKVDEYENLKKIANEKNIQISEKKSFSVEELWIIIGKYATHEGVKIDLELKNNVENIKFKVNGEFEKILNFINDLEVDSTLKFEVKEFKIEKLNKEYSSTFYVDNIEIRE